MKNDLLIYGANGQVGRAVVEELRRRGIAPILAGRSAQKIADLCVKYRLSARVWDPEKGSSVALLNNVRVLVNCAGPFRNTARALSRVCLEHGVHYLDTSGEITTTEAIHRGDKDWAEKGLTAVPGICPEAVIGEALTGKLKDEAGGAASVRITAHSLVPPRPTRGAADSFIESLATGCMAIKKGRLRQFPAFRNLKTTECEGEPISATQVAGAELSAVWHAHGIKDIEAWRSCQSRELCSLRQLSRLQIILRFHSVRSWLGRSLWLLQDLSHTCEEEEIHWQAVLKSRTGSEHRMSAKTSSLSGFTAGVVAELARHLSDNEIKGGVKTAGKILGPGPILELATI